MQYITSGASPGSIFRTGFGSFEAEEEESSTSLQREEVGEPGEGGPPAAPIPTLDTSSARRPGGVSGGMTSGGRLASEECKCAAPCAASKRIPRRCCAVAPVVSVAVGGVEGGVTRGSSVDRRLMSSRGGWSEAPGTGSALDAGSADCGAVDEARVVVEAVVEAVVTLVLGAEAELDFDEEAEDGERSWMAAACHCCHARIMDKPACEPSTPSSFLIRSSS